MGAQPQPQTQQQPFTAYNARLYRKNHQQLLHIINRILNRLDGGERRITAKAVRVIHGLHGMMNGQDLPIFRAHRWAARQMDYHGSDENSDQFMSRALSALREAEERCGRKFFEIRRADGVTQLMTSYDRDYLSEAAEWALVEVKNSAGYVKNPAAAVTDEIIDAAVGMLPEFGGGEPPDDDGGASITDDAIIKALQTQLQNRIASLLQRATDAGSNPLIEAEKLNRFTTKTAKKIYSDKCNELERERGERMRALLATGGDEIVEGGNNTSDTFAPDEQPTHEPPAEELPPRQTDPPSDPEIAEMQPLAKAEPARLAPDMLEWALYWASNNIPVFPLHTIKTEGVCTCRAGAKCKSAGKHPRTFHGLTDATTDAEKIKRWWRGDPAANIAGVMGGAARLLVLDVDPRHGGDLSLCDLVEAHGEEWLDTWQVKTGSGGFHFVFNYPGDVELRNTVGLLAPGIDTRAEGGYIVLPPSLHASLKRYKISNLKPTRTAPRWLIEELTRAPQTAPAQVISFQEKRTRSHGGDVIPEGERNERLFRVGCALWGHGEAADLPDLHCQLLEVNARRCAPPLGGDEVAKMAASIAGRYPRGVPVEEGEARRAASDNLKGECGDG